MALFKVFICFFVAAHVLGDDAKAKTTQAVLEAVTHAEQKPVSEEDKKASAVVEATMKVLKAEGVVDKNVAADVIAKAKEEAKETFEQLDEAKVGTKAAADAAAKVAVAEVDGAAGRKVGKDVEVNAEKAAVAAGKGVADHPTDLSGALSEAVNTVKKEEETKDAVDINRTQTGVVAGAVAGTEKVVSDVTAEAGAVVEDHGVSVLAIPCLLGVAFLAHRILIVQDTSYVSPYMKALMMMREADKEGESQERKDCEFSEYRAFA